MKLYSEISINAVDIEVLTVVQNQSSDLVIHLGERAIPKDAGREFLFMFLYELIDLFLRRILSTQTIRVSFLKVFMRLEYYDILIDCIGLVIVLDC